MDGDRIPLMLYEFDLIDTTNDQSIFDGQNWLDVELNLYESLPNNVDFTSIDFRKLSSLNDLDWEYFNSENYGYQNQTSMSLGYMNQPLFCNWGNRRT